MATLVPKANETSVHLPWGGGVGVAGLGKWE